jgi:hypothetical protein
MGGTCTPILCITAIRRACLPQWINTRTYPSPIINPTSEGSHLGTLNHLYTTQLITQIHIIHTRNPHITLVLFIQPIPTEQVIPPSRAIILNQIWEDTTGHPLRQRSLYRSVKAFASFAPKLENYEICTPQSWSFSPSNVPGGTHGTTSPTYETGYDPRSYQPSHQGVQSQYVPVTGSSHSNTNMTDGPHM